MNEENRVLVKVPPARLSDMLFVIAVLSCVMCIAGIRTFDSLKVFFCEKGWLVLIILYVTANFSYSYWVLYEDKLVVKFPMRPFYKRFEFQLTDIEKVTFTIRNLVKLNPWIKIYSKNKQHRIYDFSFMGDREKMRELLNALSERNIQVETK